VAYAPLGRGLLTGALNTKQSISGEGDYRASLYPRFSDENFDTNVKIVKQLEAMAAKKGCTAAQLAIAWVLKQGPDFIPIPGTKRIKYLEENFGALKVELSDAEEAQMRTIVAPVAGERVPDFAKYQCYVDTAEE
jgi:aryl-alcohol dehydrogenase-like predicted oxidoreductase